MTGADFPRQQCQLIRGKNVSDRLAFRSRGCGRFPFKNCSCFLVYRRSCGNSSSKRSLLLSYLKDFKDIFDVSSVNSHGFEERFCLMAMFAGQMGMEFIRSMRLFAHWTGHASI